MPERFTPMKKFLCVRRDSVTYNVIGIALLALAMFAASRIIDPGAAGVSVAFLGFIGKAIKTVVGTVGKAVGIGSSSNKPIQIITGTDPNILKLAESNAALVASVAAQQNKTAWYKNPFIIVPALAATGLVVWLVVRKR